MTLSLVTPAAPPAVDAERPTFAGVYELYFPFVWRSARRLGIPDALLEDVTQEIFLVVHQKLPGFEGRGTVRSWLFSIVLRVVRAHLRVLARKHPHSLRPAPPADLEAIGDPAGHGPHEVAVRHEAERFLHAFLESLDDQKREVFILAELEQMSAPEIALAVEANANTVYSRLRLARESFAVSLTRHRARDARRNP